MVELLSTFSAETLLIVLVICIPYIIKGIKAIYNFFQHLKERRQATLDEGRRLQREEQEIENRFEAGEERIDDLEAKENKLEDILKHQQDLIDLLVWSDELDIKAWIKLQHDKALLKKSIDSETRDLLEQRFAIYKKEGGNGWAEQMMKDIRNMPVVTRINNDE